MIPSNEDQQEILQSRFSEWTISSSSKTARTSDGAMEYPERRGMTSFIKSRQSRPLPPPPLPTRQLIPTTPFSHSPVTSTRRPTLPLQLIRQSLQRSSSLPLSIETSPSTLPRPSVNRSATESPLSQPAATIRPKLVRPPSLPVPILPPFAALLLSPSPSSSPLMISINVGGTTFVVLSDTILRQDSKLKDFISSSITLDEDSGEPDLVFDYDVYSSGEDSDGDGSEGSLIAHTTGRFPSPLHSPFPLSSVHHSNTPDQLHTLDHIDSNLLMLPESPVGGSQFLQTKGLIEQVQFINSPLPHLRIHSLVPSLCSPIFNASVPLSPLPELLAQLDLQDETEEEYFRSPRDASTPDQRKEGLDSAGNLPSLRSRRERESKQVSVKRSDKVEDDVMRIFLDRNPSAYPAIMGYMRDASLPSYVSLPRGNPTDAPPNAVDSTILSLLSLSPSYLIDLLLSIETLFVEASWLGLSELSVVAGKEYFRIVEIVREFNSARDRTSRTGWI
jgi:hypothetical protein